MILTKGGISKFDQPSFPDLPRPLRFAVMVALKVTTEVRIFLPPFVDTLLCVDRSQFIGMQFPGLGARRQLLLRLRSSRFHRFVQRPVDGFSGPISHSPLLTVCCFRVLLFFLLRGRISTRISSGAPDPPNSSPAPCDYRPNLSSGLWAAGTPIHTTQAELGFCGKTKLRKREIEAAWRRTATT